MRRNSTGNRKPSLRSSLIGIRDVLSQNQRRDSTSGMPSHQTELANNEGSGTSAMPEEKKVKPRVVGRSLSRRRSETKPSQINTAVQARGVAGETSPRNPSGPSSSRSLLRRMSSKAISARARTSRGGTQVEKHPLETAGQGPEIGSIALVTTEAAIEAASVEPHHVDSGYVSESGGGNGVHEAEASVRASDVVGSSHTDSGVDAGAEISGEGVVSQSNVGVNSAASAAETPQSDVHGGQEDVNSIAGGVSLSDVVATGEATESGGAVVVATGNNNINAVMPGGGNTNTFVLEGAQNIEVRIVGGQAAHVVAGGQHVEVIVAGHQEPMEPQSVAGVGTAAEAEEEEESKEEGEQEEEGGGNEEAEEEEEEELDSDRERKFIATRICARPRCGKQAEYRCSCGWLFYCSRVCGARVMLWHKDQCTAEPRPQADLSSIPCPVSRPPPAHVLQPRQFPKHTVPPQYMDALLPAELWEALILPLVVVEVRYAFEFACVCRLARDLINTVVPKGPVNLGFIHPEDVETIHNMRPLWKLKGICHRSMQNKKLEQINCMQVLDLRVWNCLTNEYVATLGAGNITHLNASGCDRVTTVQGLHTIQHLCMDSTGISDLTPLRNGRLKYFRARGCRITTADGLEGVEEVSLPFCRSLRDVTALEGARIVKLEECSSLKNVRALYRAHTVDLRFSAVTDVSDLGNVHTLLLDAAQDITDLSPLANTYRVEALNVSANLSVLATVKEYLRFGLSNWQPELLPDLSVLCNIPNIMFELVEPLEDLRPFAECRSITIEQCPNVSDLSPLAGIEELVCDSPLVADVSALGGLRKLVLKGAMITDVSNLGNLKHLELIQCYHVSDVSALGNIVTLVIEDNDLITDVGALGNHYSLSLINCKSIRNVASLNRTRRLDLTNCISITDVTCLGNQENLALTGCSITDVSTLGFVRRLKLRECTEITDVSALTCVQDLDLHGCRGVTLDTIKLCTRVERLNLGRSSCSLAGKVNVFPHVTFLIPPGYGDERRRQEEDDLIWYSEGIAANWISSEKPHIR